MTREEAIADFKEAVENAKIIVRAYKTNGLTIKNVERTIERDEMAISALSTEGEYIKKADMERILYSTNNAVRIGEEFLELPTYSFPDSKNKGEWIPVSERLPKPYEIVIRTVKSIGWNGTSRIYVDFGSICPIDTDVIAWQPLPEPYKGE